MSKKKIISKKLRKGRFYTVHDGSDNGHPGMIYWKNDKKNLYLSLTTGTSYTDNLISLKYPTDKDVQKSYANKRPFLGKRKDYGKNEYPNMKFHKRDKKTILRSISKKQPRYSKNISRKDKRYYLKVIKRKKIKY